MPKRPNQISIINKVDQMGPANRLTQQSSQILWQKQTHTQPLPSEYLHASLAQLQAQAVILILIQILKEKKTK